MKQPDLGKKIAELRKAKGLTQEELVEKCNLNVRSLQRIESGEVTPRSYTIKAIFSALDYDVYDLAETTSGKFDKTGLVILQWPGQLYRYVKDLFNLKTNTMKKISILTITLLAICIGLFFLCTDSNAQKAVKAIKAIENKQKKWNEWINHGQIDSIMTQIYRSDATILPTISGYDEIRESLKAAIDGGFKMIDFRNLQISVGDSIAVQKSDLSYEFGGATYRQKSLTEWRLTKGEWFVVNDIMVNY